MKHSSLSLRGVRVRLGGRVVLDNFDLDVKGGERVVLAGPSGSGKSTLLRAIAGLVPIEAGEIRVDGEPVHDLDPGRRGIGMVFQQPTLLPHKNVRDNLTFGLRARRVPAAEARRRAEEAADWLELSRYLDCFPRELSGGEQQRVALGRALLRESGVVLLDEPLSQLDAPLRARLREELLRLHELTHTTILHVTHDQQEAMALGHRIGILQEGRLLQIDSPQSIYQQPVSTAVARFVGSPGINLLDLQREGQSWHWLQHPVTQMFADREALQMGLRPEHLHPARSADEGWPMDIARREILGERELWHLRTAHGQALVASRPATTTEPPRHVHIKADLDKALFFDPQSGQRVVA